MSFLLLINYFCDKTPGKVDQRENERERAGVSSRDIFPGIDIIARFNGS